MRKLLCGALLLVGCFDWESLSTRFNETPGEPDLATTPGDDLAVGGPADMATTTPADLRTPPDMSPALTWTKEQAAPVSMAPLHSIFGAGTVAGGNLVVWVVGDAGQVLKYDPTNKSWGTTTVGPATDNYRDVWLKDDNSAGWIVGNSLTGATAYRWTGSAWMADTNGLGTSQLVSVWSNAPDNVLAGGLSTANVYLYTTTWANRTNAVGKALSGAWGAGTRYWMMSSNNDALYVDGTTHTKVSACGGGSTVFTTVWGFGTTDVWAAGDSGFICRWNPMGLSWTRQDQVSGTPNFRGIWGTSAQNIWAVGEAGNVAHYDGTTWTRLTPTALSGRRLNAIWGADAQNFWVVSDKGEIFRAY
jgi:hypothetical protein